jgi:uncharacterized protein DUF4124
MESAGLAAVKVRDRRVCRPVRAACIRGQRTTLDEAAAKCQLSTPRGPKTFDHAQGNRMKSSLLLILLAAAGLASTASAGTIYKCAGPTGAIVFSQTPCGKDAAQIASNGSKASAPAGDAGSDRAALEKIAARCDAGSHKIVDGYSAQFAEANASIADLHRQLMVPGPDGVAKDAAVQKKIDALEAQKTEMLGSQDREISTLRDQCQVERTAEMKRQSDRAMVKR